ncbi:MAG: adenylate/guanylate cyclase domain-containing protein [Candidatus Aminicenantes bacterium]|nr:adenylate/guanylate cyclase domain-containing protein [Candidatus Aminicenantes bacterium]
MSRKSLLPYALIALLVGFLAVLTDHRVIPGTGTRNQLELRSIDFRFLFKPKPKQDAAKDIIVIAIDEEDYKKINQPLILYHTYISEVIRYLVDAGVKTIGLDMELPSISLEDKIEGGYESVYMRSFLAARKKGVAVAIGFSLRDQAPLQGYLVAAGEANLATFFLTEDADDHIRRQQLSFEAGGKRYEAMSGLLARIYSDRPLSGPGQTILIDYSLAPSIPVYSFHDVYERSQKPGPPQGREFENKVVLLGSSLSFEDKHSTPLSFSSRKMTDGVVIQAAALATLLSGRSFREPGTLAGACLIYAITLLTIWLCYRRRPVPAAFICLAETGVLLGASVLAFNRLYLVRLMPLLAAIVFSFVATAVFHYYAEERKRIRIRKRFACYVPDGVIDQIIDADIDKLTEGEQRRLALLFIDIRGFTSYAESNKDDPQKVVRFLNRYHTEMTDIIVGGQGTVSQLTGDGIFAFFGAPQRNDDPVFAAVSAALRMKEAISGLRPEWRRYGLEDLRVGMGIHFGDAIVGNMGSTKKMDYTAIGDNTNIASRIEGLTKEYRETILISEAAYERVRERVIARSLGSAAIKGHSGVKIFAVDGLREVSSREQGTTAGLGGVQ